MSNDEQIRQDISEIKNMLQSLLSMSEDSCKVDHNSKYAAKLIQLYGECVDKTTAAQILGVTRETVYNMLKDGRIVGACEGSKVSVRSIAEYMNRPYSPKSGDEICIGSRGELHDQHA